MNSITISKHTRTYATFSALQRALTKYGLDNVRHIIVCTETGRYTAIFSATDAQQRLGQPVAVAQHGFIVMN